MVFTRVTGGPVFNQQGQLAAVLWGTDGRIVGGTYCIRVRQFLAGALRCQRTPTAEPRDAATDASPSRPDIGDDGRRGSGSAASVGEKLDSDKVRAIARSVAADVLADGTSAASRAWPPALMAALGWTGPPALAAMFALKLVGMMLRQRESGKGVSAGRHGRLVRPCKSGKDRISTAGQASSGSLSQHTLNDDYAQQLAEVYALSGRSATADATLGRAYDEELIRAEQSSDASLADWAKRVREAVANKFYRIHSDSPSPVEPVSNE